MSRPEQTTFRVARPGDFWARIYGPPVDPEPGDIVAMSAGTVTYETSRWRRRQTPVSIGELGHSRLIAVAEDGAFTCTGVRPSVGPGQREYLDSLPAAYFVDVDRFLAEAGARAWQLPAFTKTGELVRLLRAHATPDGLAWLAEVVQ
ncbi:hypothetical protein [Frankia sp. R82]|uniref:hypothetical protein n=1 Tax=Frankia sp. R82 TaxID=2950553 RepID=UPI002042E45F|nr:hypothetical protein [Frankia sp. R82]MCM3884115.1 hypothetical protein [Frankia sp. R82]